MEMDISEFGAKLPVKNAYIGSIFGAWGEPNRLSLLVKSSMRCTWFLACPSPHRSGLFSTTTSSRGRCDVDVEL